jgi:hypothetical protein
MSRILDARRIPDDPCCVTALHWLSKTEWPASAIFSNVIESRCGSSVIRNFMSSNSIGIRSVSMLLVLPLIGYRMIHDPLLPPGPSVPRHASCTPRETETENIIYWQLEPGAFQPVLSLGRRLEYPGSVPGRGRISAFSTVSTPTLGPSQLTAQWVRGYKVVWALNWQVTCA